MSIRAVPPPDAGPIDAELRAMLERVIARRPLAAMIVFETAGDFDVEAVPKLESVRRGLVDYIIHDLGTDLESA